MWILGIILSLDNIIMYPKFYLRIIHQEGSMIPCCFCKKLLFNFQSYLAPIGHDEEWQPN